MEIANNSGSNTVSSVNQTLFPMPSPRNTAPFQPSSTATRNSVSRPTSTPPFRTFPPLAHNRQGSTTPDLQVTTVAPLLDHPASPQPQQASVALPGDGISAEIVQLAAETLNRMCLASPHRTPTLSCLSPVSAASLNSPLPFTAGTATATTFVTLEQAKTSVVQALGTLSVRDTGPFIAFLDDLVQQKYCHVLQQHRTAAAAQHAQAGNTVAPSPSPFVTFPPLPQLPQQPLTAVLRPQQPQERLAMKLAPVLLADSHDDEDGSAMHDVAYTTGSPPQQRTAFSPSAKSAFSLPQPPFSPPHTAKTTSPPKHGMQISALLS